MTSKMSTAKILAMSDKRIGDAKKPLLNRARIVENSSPEPRHTIHMWDTMMDWKEKTRLGINFNRSVTMSLESRWEVVNRLTVEFLKEVISLNDQLSEEASKQARQLLTLILTRTKRLGMASKMEQMAGLLMHITFYRTVLKAKVEEMRESTSFLFHCSELMGFTHPTQIMDRYTALKACLGEIREDNDVRVQYLAKLQDEETDYVESCLRESIMLHNTMASLHVRLKDLRSEITELERFIEDKEQQEAEAMLRRRKIKASVHHCYTAIMTYKGLECRETNLMRQMEEFGIRLTITLAAVKIVEDQLAKDKLATETVVEHQVRSQRQSSGVFSVVLSTQENSSLQDTLGSEPLERGGLESNRSGNWRPCLGEKPTSTPHLIADACDNLTKLPAGLDRVKSEDSSRIAVRNNVLSANMPLMSSCGGNTSTRLVIHRRCTQPFRSTDETGLERQRRLKQAFPAAGSLSIDERREANLRQSHDLHIKERAHSVCAGERFQLSPSKRCDTHDAGQDSNSRCSYREQRLRQARLKGVANMASSDQSSNKSLVDFTIPTPTSSSKPTRGRDVLPRIASRSSSPARGSHSPITNPIEKPVMRSVTSMPSLSRLSVRLRNQLHNVNRLYYLSSPPKQAAYVMGEGYWDDGVFISAPPCCSKERKRTTKKSLTDEENKSSSKKNKPSPGHMTSREVESAIWGKPRRLKSLSSFKNLYKSSATNQTEKEASILPVQNRSRSQSLHAVNLTDSKKEHKKLPSIENRKPKTSSTPSKRSMSTNPCRCPIRRPGSLFYHRRHEPAAASLPPNRPVEISCSASAKANAWNLTRRLYQTRNFKRDCLTILANVKLGPRWSDNEPQTF